ncbi:hypothetical protein [Hymenobacter metallilatus]|uniref:DUF4876 domain-containing protein n=1 Tax=Hymenobacter metallilatus TaxID=2493666 RepID=A0A3R9NPX6_9BACT|nr:hypothetical protein [Hymenobacter metallilatus]RSK34027.1 hypothetical protein EI290_10010 [Hymenobacter metallilatus]
MKRFLFATLLTLPGLLFSACQVDSGVIICEDGTTPNPPGPVPATIKEVLTQLGPPVQKFMYDPTRTNTFAGQKGTVFTITPHAFLKNGQPVTGPVELAVREVFSRADMVLSNMPTISNGTVLQSAGEVYLRAAQDSSIQLSANAIVRIQTQNPPGVSANDTMRLFVAPVAPVAQTSCFNWMLNTDPASSISPTPTGHIITVSSLLYNAGIGWFNCDRFYYTPTLPLTITVPGTNISPMQNTMVFAVFRSFNGTLSMCDFTAPNIFRASRAPQGATVSVVVIRTENGKLYYGRKDGVVQASADLSPTLQETTPADLVASLNTL